MYNHILVPTDGSPGMARVIDHAARLARIHDATLEFLYVVDVASVAAVPMESAWEGLAGRLEAEGEAALDTALERADAPRVEAGTAEGSPSAAIVDRSRDPEVDLVVMGTHGRGGLNRLLLGSVAERVVRSAAVPVLTVRVGTSEDAPEEATANRRRAADPGLSEALE